MLSFAGISSIAVSVTRQVQLGRYLPVPTLPDTAAIAFLYVQELRPTGSFLQILWATYQVTKNSLIINLHRSKNISTAPI